MLFPRLVALSLVLILVGCDSEGPPGGADSGVGSMDAGGGDVDGGGTGSDAGGSGDDGGTGTDGGGPSDAGDVDAGDVDAGAVDGGPVSMPCMAMGDCDPFDPSACMAGQKCQVTATGTACVDLTMDPPLGRGATCGVDTECGPGLWCLSFGDGFECMPMCPNGSIGACGADAACIGTVGMEACVRVCRAIPPRCDIYAQDCADPGDMCTFATNPESRENYTGCRPNGTLTLGEACGGDLGTCSRGLVCIREGMETSCRQVCGPDGAAPTCASGECTGLARSWGVPYCR